MHTATEPTYTGLDTAYQFLNQELFSGTLPPCALTLQRKAHSFGYHHADKFVSQDGTQADEIALNPDTFIGRTQADVLSTLAHEMCHCWQKNFGKPSATAYHNQQFADKMEEIGLITSDTGAPGGKRTGQKMSHYIDPDGKFAKAAHELGFLDLISWASVPEALKSKKSPVSKAKFTCPNCGQNAWAKPTANLVCGDCSEGGGAWWPMEPAQ